MARVDAIDRNPRWRKEPVGWKEGRPVFAPDVVILPTAAEVDKYAVSVIGDQLRRKPTSVIFTPTGNTQLAIYDGLVKAGVDFSRATLRNLDGQWRMRKNHPNSYNSYMHVNLLDHTTVGDWDIPNEEAANPHDEAQRYAESLRRHQPADLVWMGLGPLTTCHIGFNERGSTVDSRTRYIEKLDEQTLQTNSALYVNPDEIPHGAITMGIADMLEGKHLVLVAKGGAKAWGVLRMLTGDISPDAPASFLRLHPNVTIILDEEAASLYRQFLSGQNSNNPAGRD